MDSSEKIGASGRPTAGEIVAHAKKKIDALPYTNALDFLAGIRQIANEFNEKTSEVEQELAASCGELGEKLEELREHKRGLLELKRDVTELRDNYLSSARNVVSVLQEKDPELLKRMESAAEKMNKLREINMAKEGYQLLEDLSATESLENSPDDIAMTEDLFRKVVEHAKLAPEFDRHFPSKVSEVCQLLSSHYRNKLCKYLDGLKYPFDEDDMKFVPEDAEDIVVKLMVLLYKLTEQKCVGTGEFLLPGFLFEPVKDRFIFHFYGTRKTNDKANPRWFFTQLLSWSRACAHFYDRVMSNVVKELNLKKNQFLGSFHAQISQLAIKKINALLADDEVLNDPVLFSKLIDECIDFEEQRQHVDIGGFGNNSLTSFCEPSIRMKWIKMESEICISRLDDILQDEDRWKSRLGELGEVDEYKACRSADAFVVLVTCLRSRVRLLPDQTSRRLFVDLQLLLFDDFLKRLTQISNLADSPWAEPFPQIMNAIWYLCDTVQDWNDSGMLFDSSMDSSNLENTSRMYKFFWSKMADDVVASVRVKAHDLVHQYQQQRWSSMETFSVSMKEVSPLFCPLLMQVRSSFASAATLISKASLASLFQRTTTAVAKLLIKELVVPTTFVESGAAQMLYDVEQGLIPVLTHIFQRSGVDTVNPEYNQEMTRLLGFLRLLSLSWPVASLLRQEMSNAPDEIIEEKLAQMKIAGVSADEAHSLFDHRSDMQSGKLVAMKMRKL